MKPKLWISIVLLALALVACSDESVVSISLSGLNYTKLWITSYTVDGYEGFGIEPGGGGGGSVCCMAIPRKWRPGIKVIVRWTNDEPVPNWKERVVEVPEYTERDFGAFAVHFFPDDSVKVLVTAIIVGHPNYPYPRPK